MIIALAGRRIDAPDGGTPRFPLANRELVRQRLRDAFLDLHGRALACSAACGADLLALDVAGALGMERHIILPFAEQRFRQTSVVDRPGDWGPMFDRICREVKADGRLFVLPGGSDEGTAYAEVTKVILDIAHAHASVHPNLLAEAMTAVVVWDGASRGPEDLTERFSIEATARGIPVIYLSTLSA